MLRFGSRRLTPRFVPAPSHSFSVFKALLHLIRTSLNRVRWEENQQFTELERRSSSVPKTPEQATQLFIATEQQVSLNEKDRMQRIDSILGTSTYFHEGKVYQERIDSDHIMNISQLQRENPEKSRQTLDWLNPQADIKIRYKNKRKYYQLLSKLRSYPSHQPGKYELEDETNHNTIAFLAAETAYATISLKTVDLTAASLEQEALMLPPERPFESRLFCYFRPQFSMQLLRVSKNLYTSSLLTDPTAIEQLGSEVEAVISLDEIYEALKEYDTDQRVHQYLRKVENNRVEYLFAALSFDQSENTVAITIDILDNGTEHCLLIKSLASPEKILRPIFNMQPSVLFSPDGRSVYYVQRSAEGGWIELVKREVTSCWGTSDLALVEEEEEEEEDEIVYRCSPQKQLKLGKDSNGHFIFVSISEYGRQYTQKLYVISSKEGTLELLPVDEDGTCTYFYDMSPQGLVVGRRRKVESGQLKYGDHGSYFESVQLIPFKQSIQLQTDKVGLTDLLPGRVLQQGPKPEELDYSKKHCIFAADALQFITAIEVRNTHIVLALNYFSVYDRAILYLLPFRASAHPHSLILKGGAQLQLRANTYSYANQQIEFSQPQGPLLYEKKYNIWKRQLSEDERQASRYYHQTFTLNEQDHPFELHFICKELYLEQKELPVVFVVLEHRESFDQSVLRQFLEKGVAVVQFQGRGTFSRDISHFLGGSRHNYNHMLDDFQTAIEFVGNSMTTNISLYCKGQVSSLLGLWFNLYFPYLFNASVLHNGLYDLSDHTALNSYQAFFGNEQTSQNDELPTFDFKRFNFFSHSFRAFSQPDNAPPSQDGDKFSIGQLQNMIISSERGHRLHSRRVVKRLRENHLFKYQEVYLKEYEDSYEADLINFSYLYSKVRARLEREVHQQAVKDEDDDDE